jgi:GT2 family glycosyltransferase
MFDRRPIVGIEGRIYSDRYLDPAWRSVHNYGAEGVGFMTANLFATAEAFHAVGGFDSGFDAFGAREDTDLGWRLTGLGEIPFSEAVLVYHPPWSRDIPRESLAERDRMLEADALLLFKHPDRFRELFFREGQWLKGAAYWGPFMRGATTLGLELPDYIEEQRRKYGVGI